MKIKEEVKTWQKETLALLNLANDIKETQAELGLKIKDFNNRVTALEKLSTDIANDIKALIRLQMGD